MPVIAENTAETPAIACGLHAIICGLQVVKLRHSKVKWLIVMWLVGGWVGALVKRSGSTQVCSSHGISFPILENKNVHQPESGILFALWYLRVNLTFPMNSKLEQKFDKNEAGQR